jgi:cytoskeletal protein CcmA (bactofilin family)
MSSHMFKGTGAVVGDLKEVETIIGHSIKIKGNFHGQGNIVIEGEVEGSIKTDNFLLVGDKARIIANIEAKNAKISGEVTGNLKIDGYLEILSSARILGDIETKEISIEKGARFNGKCIVDNIHKDNKASE